MDITMMGSRDIFFISVILSTGTLFSALAQTFPDYAGYPAIISQVIIAAGRVNILIAGLLYPVLIPYRKRNFRKGTSLLAPVPEYPYKGGICVEDIYHRIYGKLQRMGVLEVRQYAIIEMPPFIPLCIDRISEDCYALSQNKVIDGFLVADPDVEIRIDTAKKTAEPVVYQDRSARKVVYPEPGTVNLQVKNDLAASLERWLDDLLSQGFIHRQ